MQMEKVNIKICDVRDVETAKYCEQLGVGFLGIHQIKYPLSLEKKNLVDKIKAVTNNVKLVLVTQEKDIDKLLEICSECDWDYIQLHFKITPKEIIDLKQKLLNRSLNIKIISVIETGKIEEYDVNMLSKVSDYLLFDSSIRGGTGVYSSISDLEKIKQIANGKKFFVAGGLNDRNVINTIRICEPYAVDVQSGVEFIEPELKHRKDPKRIYSFVKAVNAYKNYKYDDELEREEIF